MTPSSTGSDAGRRTAMLALTLALVGLPLAFAFASAVAFYDHNRADGRIVSSGLKRTFLVHLPDGYDPARPVPLVLSLHGGEGWAAQQRDLTGWSRLADEEGFIVVYPEGTEHQGPRGWHVGDGAGLDRDVRFVSDLLDQLEATYAVDPARVYANGLSNGGGMSFVLSCTLADRIAAVGLVAPALTLPFDWCPSDVAVPMITFHGTADPIVPYEGGKVWVAPEPFPAVEAFTSQWASHNGCEPTPIDEPVADDVVRREYQSCRDGATVVLYSVLGGGHTWPGGEELPEWFAGPTNHAVDATRAMWEFFATHPGTSEIGRYGARDRRFASR